MTMGLSSKTLTEADLRELWPDAFNDARRPLKIGIHADMGIPPDDDAMRAWTDNPTYLRSLIAGGPRYGLDGEPAGSVSADEQDHAMRQTDGSRRAAA
jgi:ProP effector